MDCIHARVLIVLQGRDSQELDSGAQTALDAHLEQCADCLAWSHQQSRVDEALGGAILNVPVPAALPSKILHTLEHQRRPRVPWLSAAAAVLLLAIGGGYWWYTDKPALSLGDFTSDVAQHEVSSPEDVKQWFAEMGLAMEVPKDFGFDNCNDYMVAKISGYRLPRLQYIVRGEGEARPVVADVYVVDQQRFQVDEIVRAIEQNDVPIVTSEHRIQALPCSHASRFIFVVVFTGTRLEAFFPRVVG